MFAGDTAQWARLHGQSSATTYSVGGHARRKILAPRKQLRGFELIHETIEPTLRRAQ